MRKVTNKKKEMENGDNENVEKVESEEENGVEEDGDPLATTGSNGNDEHDGDAEEQENAETISDDDEPLKPSKASKKAAKKEKKAAKKAAKKAKKTKKRVSLNVPADKDDQEDESDNEDDEEYEVQEIVGHRYVGKQLEYKIRWKGYSAKDDTWEPKKSLSCPDKIKKYEENHDTSMKSNNKKGGTKRKATTSPKKSAKKAKDELEDSDEDDEKEYEVARILDVRVKKNGNREFLVHWKGWSSRFDNWEPEDNLNCDELIADFDKKLEKAKSATQKELRVAPKTTKRYVVNSKPKGARSSKRGSGKNRVTYFDDE
uniref:CSON002945 protein n=1 Tax=Culicoides sonorensis TaxID=179676 RepID=A0A336LVR4_CULSO